MREEQQWPNTATNQSNPRNMETNKEQLEQYFLKVLFDSFKGNPAKQDFLR
jgi:hypothetical protein